MSGLTERQAQILNLVIESITESHVCPTIRELMRLADIKSLRGVTAHLDALERKGYIVRDPSKVRGVEALKDMFGNRIMFKTEVVLIDG